MTTSATERRKCNTSERREFVFELRKAGTDYRTIAKQVVEHFGAENVPKGYDERQAYKDVKAVLDKLYAHIDSMAKDVLNMELERLDRMLLGIWQQARGGHLGAIDRAIRIMDRRAKMLGLDAPSKAQSFNVDLTQLTDEQLDRLIKGEDIVSVIATKS